jgi:hypothetical protein
MIQWQYIAFFGTIVGLVAAIVAGILMVMSGSDRISNQKPRGRLLFWSGGPILGLSISGLFIGMMFQANISTTLVVALVLAVIAWVGARLLTRFA